MLEDETGNRWLVANGDPAYPLMHVLNNAGFEYVVLPAVVFCGIMRIPHIDPPDDLVRATRLNDCLHTLVKAGALSNS